jgi:hypothetical protein
MNNLDLLGAKKTSSPFFKFNVHKSNSNWRLKIVFKVFFCIITKFGAWMTKKGNSKVLKIAVPIKKRKWVAGILAKVDVCSFPLSLRN